MINDILKGKSENEINDSFKKKPFKYKYAYEKLKKIQEEEPMTIAELTSKINSVTFENLTIFLMIDSENILYAEVSEDNIHKSINPNSFGMLFKFNETDGPVFSKIV